MEKQGLIKRIKDPGNHKRVKIISTDKGDKAYYRSIERESIHNMFSCLSKEEQQQLTTCLVKIVEAALKENTKLKHMAAK
jgi:DNA-binding MarR family transcriptional regulator